MSVRRHWRDTMVTARSWTVGAGLGLGATNRSCKDENFAKRIFTKTEDMDKIVIDRVNEVARARGLAPSQIRLAWLFHKPVITAPIVGATKPNHLEVLLRRSQ